MKKLFILLSTFFLSASSLLGLLSYVRHNIYLQAMIPFPYFVLKKILKSRRVRYLNRNWRSLQTQNRV